MTAESIAVPGWRHIYSGKVRDLYVPEDGADLSGSSFSDTAEIRAGAVMVVASDRISAFDHVLPTLIPDKGKILTQMSAWWFEQLADIPNHVLTLDVPEQVAGRAMICKSLSMFPVECIARGYLTGSGLKEYQAHGPCGAGPSPRVWPTARAWRPRCSPPPARRRSASTTSRSASSRSTRPWGRPWGTGCTS
ncbi:Phosphoribosylaminoimidazole-succinocarboxamide synthase [Rothia kristinae]|nr:Phosphoribosylaminoimidazole-succinocarboxamide synthase [Rothia kristinae]